MSFKESIKYVFSGFIGGLLFCLGISRKNREGGDKSSISRERYVSPGESAALSKALRKRTGERIDRAIDTARELREGDQAEQV